MISMVPGHLGECKPVWLNTNALDNRLDRGITGFFRLVKRFWIFSFAYGSRFHGIYKDGIVKTTERCEDDDE